MACAVGGPRRPLAGRCRVGLGILAIATVACGAPPEPPAPAPREEIADGVLADSSSASLPVRVEVIELRRDTPATVQMRLAVVNTATEGDALDIGTAFAGEAADEGSIAGVFLQDADAQRRYYVLRDAEGAPLCSRDIAAIAPGERRELWVRFAAPPDGTTHLEVHVPALPAIRQVPLS